VRSNGSLCAIIDSVSIQGVGSFRMRMSLGSVLVLCATLATGAAQSQFAGKWQTRVSRVTNKATITVNIVAQEQKLDGTVVLVNPDGSEIEVAIVNAKALGNLVEFETLVNADRFHWSLTLKGDRSSRGLLHGSFMLIDEAVVKRH
jgi:hypothetical protein